MPVADAIMLQKKKLQKPREYNIAHFSSLSKPDVFNVLLIDGSEHFRTPAPRSVRLWNWDVDDLLHSALLNPLLFDDLWHMDNLFADHFNFLLCHL